MPVWLIALLWPICVTVASAALGPGAKVIAGDATPNAALRLRFADLYQMSYVSTGLRELADQTIVFLYSVQNDGKT